MKIAASGKLPNASQWDRFRKKPLIAGEDGGQNASLSPACGGIPPP
jgi:hypothetical protein